MQSATSTNPCDLGFFKPLVWAGAFAHTPFGLFYRVGHVPDGAVLEKIDGASTLKSAWPNLDEAKAEAQRDYTARLVSAVATTPAPVDLLVGIEEAVSAAIEPIIRQYPTGHWRDHQVKEAVRNAIIAERQAPPADLLVGSGLSISELQRAHVERQEEWCPGQKPDLSFRGNELGGECGEAQNVIKKLERERHGWRGSRDTFEHLAEELGDVIHCAILCAITAGIDLEPAVIAKFNSTSEKNGLSTMLRAALSAPEAEG